MHLLAHVESPDHVCCRYRLRAFEPALRALGHTINYQPRPRRWWQSLTDALPGADVCIIQRRLPSSWELHRLRRRYDTLVYDFDDALWLRDSFSKKGLNSLRRLRRFAAMVQAADWISAGNEFLAAQAARFTNRDRITVLPTCIQPALYPLAEHRAIDKGIRLVWIGSSSTLQGLERIAPVLEQIGVALPGVSLKLICDRFLQLKQMQVEECRWTAATAPTELASADIGIAWMPDDDWSRGKCGLKVLQYMAAGLPVIANPVGVHCDMVACGVNGFLARTADEWIDAVRTLAADPELRRRMGAAGRARIEREYAVERGLKSWLGFLSTLCIMPRAA